MPSVGHPVSKPSHPGQALLWTVAILVSIGFLALYASSALKGHELTGNHLFFINKQLVALVCGMVIIIVFQWIPFHWIEKLPLPLMIFSLISLSLVFVPEAYVSVGGASRWLSLGPLRLQPAEPAKIALVMFLAKNMSRPGFRINTFRSGILPNLLALSLFCMLLMQQPDFGTAVLLVTVTLLMMFVSGTSLKFNLSAVLGGAALVILALLAAPYRMRRITSFMDPWSDFQAGGFQIIQSYLGFQNGGLTGAGLGESRQKLFFLPEAHTDFIFSVIGEEMGLAGSLLICLLFWNIVRLGLKISLHQPDPFKKLLAFGLTAMTGIQTAFNLGVVTGILPTKGIPLPLISNGLSSFIVYFLVIAILARLGQEVPLEARHAHKP